MSFSLSWRVPNGACLSFAACCLYPSPFLHLFLPSWALFWAELAKRENIIKNANCVVPLALLTSISAGQTWLNFDVCPWLELQSPCVCGALQSCSICLCPWVTWTILLLQWSLNSKWSRLCSWPVNTKTICPTCSSWPVKTKKVILYPWSLE